MPSCARQEISAALGRGGVLTTDVSKRLSGRDPVDQ